MAPQHGHGWQPPGDEHVQQQQQQQQQHYYQYYQQHLPIHYQAGSSQNAFYPPSLAHQQEMHPGHGHPTPSHFAGHESSLSGQMHQSVGPSVHSSMWQQDASYHKVYEQQYQQPFASTSSYSQSSANPEAHLHLLHHEDHGPSSSSSAQWSAAQTIGDLVGNVQDFPVPDNLDHSFKDSIGMMPGPSKIKPFISKLTALLSEPELYRDCLVWDQTGSSFILSHSNPRFLHDVLPKSFGHSNLQSFTRQLNVYDFKRLPLPELLEKLDLGPTASTVEYSGWYHPSFKRDDVSLLATMTPRPSRARLQKKIEKQERLEKQRRDAVEQHQSQLQQQAMQHQQQHLSHPHLPHPGYQNTYHQPPGPPR